MGIINAECGKTFRIAYQGENKRQQVRFDLADIMGEFPGGTAVLAVMRNGDADPVPAAETEMDGTALIWTVTAWECALEGFLYAQVTYAAGETVAKTKVYRFDVKNSLVVNGAEPEDWQDLVGQLVEAADGVNSAISQAMDTLDEKVTAAETAQSAAEDAQEAAETARDEAVAAVGQYDAMTAEATGLAAGEEPTAMIDHTGDHPVLQLGIPKGEKGDTGATGQAGPAGPSGVDGFSPTAGVSKVGKIATITIVDKNGTTTASVSDGADGDPGDIIDDTAGAGDTDKTFSADKLTADHSSLLSAIDGKQDAPETAGTAGQVLSLDSNLDPVWTTPQGGGGTVTDVQVNGTSIVSSGVANIEEGKYPKRGFCTVYPGYGISMRQGGTYNGMLQIDVASDDKIKSGANDIVVTIPSSQHKSTFYGLAKAAGADEKDSALPAGQYTDTAKSAISEMLNGAVSVSGTTPSITALSGVRYICGQVDTLTIVVPSSGCIDVTFESGSTPTVLTVTPPTGMTIKWANGFDPSSLEANTTYEINIMDGCLGVAGSWT